jgi:hypothetical protein
VAASGCVVRLMWRNSVRGTLAKGKRGHLADENVEERVGGLDIGGCDNECVYQFAFQAPVQ